jgi:PilZ domain
MPVSNVISMDDRSAKGLSQRVSIRDRRYAIRFPFAADAELLDLESGARSDGVTSDISLGGCFICTSRPLPVKTRTRVTLTRKGERVEALAMVRIVKPRIGMGLEFIDVEPLSTAVLSRWIEQLRRTR